MHYAAYMQSRTPGPGTVKKVAYTMYSVRDVERARAFYERTLGLVRGAAHGEWTEYDLAEGGCLLLGPSREFHPSATEGGRISLEVDGLDALVARLAAEGVAFRGAMQETAVCRMIVALDTEGNALILHELKR